MQNKSIWTIKIDTRNYPTLSSNLDIDVLIIGGGITGENVAYHLIDSGLKVCLVEKNLIGSGVTSRTTGKLNFLQDNISKIKAYHDIDKVKLYVKSQKDAISLAKNIIEKENIECNFEKTKSYLFANANEKKLQKDRKLLELAGIKVNTALSLPNSKKEVYSFYVDDTYVFNSVKYVKSLAKICNNRGISIYENTKIVSMKKYKTGYICKTNNNIIKTKYVILAMHYPYFLSPFWLPFKSYLEKSYIEAFRVEKNYCFSAINVENPVISMRYYSDNNINYQLYLSNSHNLAIKNNAKKNFHNLLNKGNPKPDYLWSNKDIMTIDFLPFIGKINDNLLIGTGYNTWGMTNGILAGKILSDIILKKPNKYIELFNPQRSIHGLATLNYLKIIGTSAYSFIKNKISKQKKWYSLNVRFEKRNGKNIAIYTDENKKEHIVYNLCPHLKCSLIFNEVEKTWDCPCHGSRFDLDGNCIEGPSNYNISYLK